MDVKKELNATPLPQRAQNANAGGPKVAANANAQQNNKNNAAAGSGQQQISDKKPPFNKSGPPNKRRFGNNNQNNNRNNGGGRPGGRRNDVSFFHCNTLLAAQMSAILNFEKSSES